jgi:uracil-DNA glycosylase
MANHLIRCLQPEKKRTQWALTTEEMKNCLWLKPKLVAQIEFMNRRQMVT